VVACELRLCEPVVFEPIDLEGKADLLELDDDVDALCARRHL
jgi:hypothetical protein